MKLKFSSRAMDTLSLNLQPGFKFSPTDVQIFDHYLKLKITGNDEELYFIREVQFFKQEPWDMPGLSGIETTDGEWFFFSSPELKQPNGKRFNRRTDAGYWKVTGKDQEIWSGASLIGKKKFLVFYKRGTGSTASKWEKTNWVTHEYHTTLKELDGTKPGQKAFVLCRLFYKPKQNSGKVGSAKSKLSLEEQAEDHPTTNESLYENSDGMTYDTSESPDKGSKARKRKCSSKAGPPKSKRSATSVYPALEKQAEDHTTTNEFLHSENSDTIASVECSDSNSHAYASENQVAEMATVIDNEVVDSNMACVPPDLLDVDWRSFLSTLPASGEEADNHVTRYYPTKAFDAYTTKNHTAQVTAGEVNLQLDEEELEMLSVLMQDPLGCNSLTPLSSLPNTPVVSSPSTAKSSPEEAGSDKRQASVSPASGEEADNHVTRYCPTKAFDGTTSNTIAFTECNHISDSAYTTKNKAAEVTAGDQVVDSNISCVTPDLIDLYWSLLSPYLDGEVPFQHGTNDPADCSSELLGLKPNYPDEFLHSDPSSQKNLAFDRETMENMESVKDDGSHSAPSAKMLNALFDPTVQDSMWSQ